MRLRESVFNEKEAPEKAIVYKNLQSSATHVLLSGTRASHDRRASVRVALRARGFLKSKRQVVVARDRVTGGRVLLLTV